MRNRCSSANRGEIDRKRFSARLSQSVSRHSQTQDGTSSRSRRHRSMRGTAAPLYYPWRSVVVLDSRIDPRSAEFAANREHNLALIEDLRQRLERARQGGAEEAVR